MDIKQDNITEEYANSGITIPTGISISYGVQVLRKSTQKPVSGITVDYGYSRSGKTSANGLFTWTAATATTYIATINDNIYGAWSGSVISSTLGGYTKAELTPSVSYLLPTLYDNGVDGYILQTGCNFYLKCGGKEFSFNSICGKEHTFEDLTPDEANGTWALQINKSGFQEYNDIAYVKENKFCQWITCGMCRKSYSAASDTCPNCGYIGKGFSVEPFNIPVYRSNEYLNKGALFDILSEKGSQSWFWMDDSDHEYLTTGENGFSKTSLNLGYNKTVHGLKLDGCTACGSCEDTDIAGSRLSDICPKKLTYEDFVSASESPCIYCDACYNKLDKATGSCPVNAFQFVEKTPNINNFIDFSSKFNNDFYGKNFAIGSFIYEKNKGFLANECFLPNAASANPNTYVTVAGTNMKYMLDAMINSANTPWILVIAPLSQYSSSTDAVKEMIVNLQNILSCFVMVDKIDPALIFLADDTIIYSFYGKKPETLPSTYIINNKEVLYKQAGIIRHDEFLNKFKNLYEYVDLGLPSGTLWAKCNVGAAKESDFGGYYQWGGTEDFTSTAKTCNWAAYPYGTSATVLTKYNAVASYGTVDNKTELELSDDVAHQVMGGDWHMPSMEQLQELIDNTETDWIPVNGVNGRTFVSKLNGNSIFIPAAGRRYGSALSNANDKCCLWTSSLYQSLASKARSLYSNSEGFGTDNYFRYYGQSVRGVLF